MVAILPLEVRGANSRPQLDRTRLRGRRLGLNSHPTVGARLFSKIAVCAVLIAITWTVFGQTLEYGFVNYDDPAYINVGRIVEINKAIFQSLAEDGPGDRDQYGTDRDFRK